MISGIGFSDDLGAGMSESSPSLMSFRPFFLQLDLPFSIKQSETLLQMITVFNYMDEAQNSLITISQDVKFTIDDPGLQWMGNLMNLTGFNLSNNSILFISFVRHICTKLRRYVKLHSNICRFHQTFEFRNDSD